MPAPSTKPCANRLLKCRPGFLGVTRIIQSERAARSSPRDESLPRVTSGTALCCFHWFQAIWDWHTVYNQSVMTDRAVKRDLSREFLTYIQVEKGLSPNTLQSYARDIAKLQAWADKNRKTVEKRERKDLREWIARMSRDGLAPTSISRAVSAARGFFRFLMLDGQKNLTRL